MNYKPRLTTIKRHNEIFDEMISQQVKSGYIDDPRKIAKKFKISRAFRSELETLGLVKKIDKKRYIFLGKDKSPNELTIMVLNERNRKKLKSEKIKKTEKMKKNLKETISTKQQTIDFQENKEVDEIVKNTKVKKKTLDKFYNMIWELLRNSGKIINKKELREIKNKNKAKYRIDDSLIYSGVIKEVDNKYLVVSNYDKTSINEWSNKSACHYSGIVVKKYSKPKKIDVIREVEIENKKETLETSNKKRTPTEKKFYSLDDFSETKKDTKSNANDSNDGNKFFRKITVNHDKLLTNKVVLINYVSALSEEKYKELIKSPIDIISFIKIICEINNQEELNKYANFILTPKELQK